MTPAKAMIRDLKRAQILPPPPVEGDEFTQADHRKLRNAMKRLRKAHRRQR